ncbi:metalloregulator ArsR/SmtB family transcription factor [Rhizobium sp. 32-5/1]|uniref:metalloregulator ArsR/SmtB family transcription factor n=1 Tax=Rhizobium sp. 32-5/1 TaxID=3019602 RepID=UPI00240DCCC5|nr:metalloregulator ArsR/SmtB family transcription factor [Rhizobium sp. 32-5/1]WEZ84045.1 metalloregulator ArsR/SmtB family transcription factor [Rhizobium sp. 32-5/1]
MDDEFLSRILKAAGDTTRRRILTLLVQEGALRVTALAAHFDMSLNSVSKHIKVLEEAGLVTRRTLGREHFIAAELEPLKLTEGWFAQLKSIWELRLAALETALIFEDEEMTELELTVNRTIAAAREKVFKAWLSPDMLAKFMAPPSGGAAPSRVSNDPVKGGRFSIVMITPEKEVPHAGTYLEIDPYSRLSFTWESPHSLSDSVVTIDFAEPEPGTTAITLHHVKFSSEGSRNGHEKGWTAIIDNLAANLG